MSFIAIAGNIGVGKSELTTRLAHYLGWKPFLELVIENPYLEDFYRDMKGYAFQLQTFLLAYRFRQHHDLLKAGGRVIQDRSLYENAEIFTRCLHETGYISVRDWHTYYSMYNIIIDILTPPALIVYLQASVPTLLGRIQNRGRSFEQQIDRAYLTNLNQYYERWAGGFTRVPIVRVPTDGINFLTDVHALDTLARQILGMIPMQPLPL